MSIVADELLAFHKIGQRFEGWEVESWKVETVETLFSAAPELWRGPSLGVEDSLQPATCQLAPSC
jgi:hypothetical protein